ncbi:MAG: glycosyltransferase family 2 protein [Proteobacteria bacterium]|nr:glycosyltransferase family 2 protein [Pseudomonadota bacterium]
MKRITVLIPTHNNCKTLHYSLKSVFLQTIQDYEIIIVGDGVSDETREIVRQYQVTDKRILFYDNPKGPRHGEIWRDEALSEATGNVVCYLSDDDIWMPDHLAQLSELLLTNDFVSALTVRVNHEGELYIYNGDLSMNSSRQSVIAGHNFMPLSSVGHTMDFYRRLPFGWQTTPESSFSDLYMWQQCLTVANCKSASNNKPTVLNFPKSMRKQMSLDERCKELEKYLQLSCDPEFEKQLILNALDFLVKSRVKEILG